MDELNNELIINDGEVASEENKKEKVKRWYICRLTVSIIMYLASLLSFFIGAVNLSDFLTQVFSLKEEMGGVLEGITFTLIVSSMSTIIIPMFMYGFILLGIGTLLLIKSKRKI